MFFCKLKDTHNLTMFVLKVFFTFFVHGTCAPCRLGKSNMSYILWNCEMFIVFVYNYCCLCC